MIQHQSSCELRDGYLGRWLTEQEQQTFAVHLTRCADCRQAVQEQQQLDQLLTRAHAVLLPTPPRLLERLDGRLRRVRRRRRAAWAMGLAAAGVLLGVLIMGLLGPQRPQEREAPGIIAEQPAPPPPAAPDPRTLVQVTFPPTANVIAVPQKTENPSVSIIWVYPTLPRKPAWSPEREDSEQPLERNGL